MIFLDTTVFKSKIDKMDKRIKLIFGYALHMCCFQLYTQDNTF